MPGPIVALLVPAHGWQILFIIGGVVPILVAIVCSFGLPESVRKLAIAEGKRAQLLTLLRRLCPDCSFGEQTEFVIRDERQYAGWSPRHLFGDGLALITPLLWLLFVLNLMQETSLVSWTPPPLTSAHLPLSKAALAQTLFQLGGAAGGWVLCRPMDNRGLMPVMILFAVAVPAVASIGYVGTISGCCRRRSSSVPASASSGFNWAFNATAASIYPTSFRSNGAGWALGIGLVRRHCRAVLGGALIALHFPVEHLFLLAAIPFAIGAVACYALTRLYVARFQGGGLGQHVTLHAVDAKAAVIRRAKRKPGMEGTRPEQRGGDEHRAAQLAPIPETAVGDQAIRRASGRLLRFLFILLVVSFMDRINIAFAGLT